MNVTDLLAAELAIDPGAGRMYGVVTGVVTNTDDPDSLARVKVSYPWLGDDAESPWARVVTPMAGGDRGFVSRPEVGDEVLLAFEHGDMRFPYVIGAMWNGVDGPPQHRGADADNNIRMIRSRSGHEIVFDDGARGRIEIHLKDDTRKVRLDPDGIEISDDKGNKIAIQSTSGAISIKSATKITIESATVEVKATASMTLQASGTLTIQGALVRIN
jgi:uncharacterized protein involved in type VI secretion and phage assembly